jgi:hypothetical protein
MASLDKVQIPQDSGFELKRAMELANLLEVAYDEYEVWDYRQTKHLPEELPPNAFICSTEFVDLSKNTVALCEKIDPKEIAGIKPKVSYGELDEVWQTKTVKHYERIANLCATEWWWLNLLDLPFLSNSFTNDLGQLFQSVKRVDGLRGLIQRASQLPKNLLDNLSTWVRDDQLFGFVAKSQSNPDEIFVVLRGTRESAEWFNNFRPVPKKFLEEQKDKFGDSGEVRNGFNRIYSEKNGGRTPTIKETITKLFEERQDLLNHNSKVFITGHSLGAGLATLAALHISKIAEEQGIQASINLYTFASPRVGDETFANKFNTFPGYRIINSEDLIQSVPLPTTQVVDDETFNSMSPTRKARTFWVRGILETITNGQSAKHYQHVGIPVTFTKQTGTIAGNHNLSKTYREALEE